MSQQEFPTLLLSPSSPPSAAVGTQMAGVIAAQSPDEVNGSTPIKSMEDLKRKAPKLYKSMIRGIAGMILRESQHHTNRLISIMRQGRL